MPVPADYLNPSEKRELAELAPPDYPPTGSGYAPIVLDWRVVVRAKRLMRQGLDLYEAAHAVGARPRNLDLSLWSNIGSEGWA